MSYIHYFSTKLTSSRMLSQQSFKASWSMGTSITGFANSSCCPSRVCECSESCNPWWFLSMCSVEFTSPVDVLVGYVNIMKHTQWSYRTASSLILSLSHYLNKNCHLFFTIIMECSFRNVNRSSRYFSCFQPRAGKPFKRYNICIFNIICISL